MFGQVCLSYYGMPFRADRCRNFADNVGITFKTPEEFFLGKAPRPFTRTFDPFGYITEAESEYHLGHQKAAGVDNHLVKPFVKVNDRDIILFCGSPGAGKSSFYWKYLKPLGYERVNQDTLKSVCTTSCFASDNADKDSVTNASKSPTNTSRAVIRLQLVSQSFFTNIDNDSHALTST